MAEKSDPIVLTPRFAEALTYAQRVHAGQLRKGTNELGPRPLAEELDRVVTEIERRSRRE